jgi:hypothetical protein
LDILEAPMFSNLSLVKPESPAAQAGEHRVIVPRRDHDPAGIQHRVRALLEKVPKLMVKRLMNLVEDEDLRLCFLGYGNSEPGSHSLRIREYWALESLAEPTPCFDVVERAERSAARKPAENAEKQGVFPTCQQLQQASVNREQRRDATTNLD